MNYDLIKELQLTSVSGVYNLDYFSSDNYNIGYAPASISLSGAIVPRSASFRAGRGEHVGHRSLHVIGTDIVKRQVAVTGFAVPARCKTSAHCRDETGLCKRSPKWRV